MLLHILYFNVTPVCTVILSADLEHKCHSFNVSLSKSPAITKKTLTYHKTFIIHLHVFCQTPVHSYLLQIRKYIHTRES